MHDLTRQKQEHSLPWWYNPLCSTISSWYPVQETRFSKELEFLNSLSTWCWWGLSFFVSLVIAFWMKFVGLNWDFFSETLPQKRCSLWKCCGFLRFLTCFLSPRYSKVLQMLWSLYLQGQEPCHLSMWLHPCAAHWGSCRVICCSSFPSYWSHCRLQKNVGVLSRSVLPPRMNWTRSCFYQQLYSGEHFLGCCCCYEVASWALHFSIFHSLCTGSAIKLTNKALGAATWGYCTSWMPVKSSCV